MIVTKALFKAFKESDMPCLALHKSYPLVRTSSAFQLFLLDRLRQENNENCKEVGGFGMLANPELDEAVFEIEDWIGAYESDSTCITTEEELSLLMKVRWYLLDDTFADAKDILDDEEPV